MLNRFLLMAACVDGKAIGVGTLVVTDIDGLALAFNGEMKSGKPDGWGTMKFRNDDTGEFDRYIGNFDNSTPKGNGIYDSSEAGIGASKALKLLQRASVPP